MLGSLTRGGGENVPGIPCACTTRNFKCLVRGPFPHLECGCCLPTLGCGSIQPTRRHSEYTVMQLARLRHITLHDGLRVPDLETKRKKMVCLSSITLIISALKTQSCHHENFITKLCHLSFDVGRVSVKFIPLYTKELVLYQKAGLFVHAQYCQTLHVPEKSNFWIKGKWISESNKKNRQ